MGESAMGGRSIGRPSQFRFRKCWRRHGKRNDKRILPIALEIQLQRLDPLLAEDAETGLWRG